jgi:Uma2 family endonuclease
MVKIDLEKTYSVEEYLALEAQSELRHDFFYGNLYELPGSTILHNEICIILWKLLRNRLAKNTYSVGGISVKVKIQGEDIFLYPDVFVCEVIANPGETIIVDNPLLIIEVQSDSTRLFNFTDKFIQFRKIDSLQYYLLVEPEKQVVIFYEKAMDGDWVAKTYTEPEETVKLPLLNASISLADIYNR